MLQTVVTGCECFLNVFSSSVVLWWTEELSRVRLRPHLMTAGIGCSAPRWPKEGLGGKTFSACSCFTFTLLTSGPHLLSPVITWCVPNVSHLCLVIVDSSVFKWPDVYFDITSQWDVKKFGCRAGHFLRRVSCEVVPLGRVSISSRVILVTCPLLMSVGTDLHQDRAQVLLSTFRVCIELQHSPVYMFILIHWDLGLQ